MIKIILIIVGITIVISILKKVAWLAKTIAAIAIIVFLLNAMGVIKI